MKTSNQEVIDCPLISSDEAICISGIVDSLRPHWTSRNEWAPFYTLGAASYLDARGNAEAEYVRRAETTNTLLENHFSALYGRILATLELQLGGAFAFRSRAARPGFHIFEWCLAFETSFASIHRDLQYNLLTWNSEEEPDFSFPISFTLPIRLPESGGGLLVWGDSIEEKEPEFHPYKVGSLVIHSGNKIHQIAPFKKSARGDSRLTLQGHAIKCKEGWQVYW